MEYKLWEILYAENNFVCISKFAQNVFTEKNHVCDICPSNFLKRSCTLLSITIFLKSQLYMIVVSLSLFSRAPEFS